MEIFFIIVGVLVLILLLVMLITGLFMVSAIVRSHDKIDAVSEQLDGVADTLHQVEKMAQLELRRRNIDL